MGRSLEDKLSSTSTSTTQWALKLARRACDEPLAESLNAQPRLSLALPRATIVVVEIEDCTETSEKIANPVLSSSGRWGSYSSLDAAMWRLLASCAVVVPFPEPPADDRHDQQRMEESACRAARAKATYPQTLMTGCVSAAAAKIRCLQPWFSLIR